ncbi:Arylsulfatase A [Salegentibacter agarivorans]|uniref:Arylsulfatase A n=1 Tax=Salegentibacter agarivorans TaxID=345907 RepID=A0A1I2KMY1_9FLAO|nr:arylsulfatase [Salegentibacter agarivorans]SFF67718.1 Arylsulfatase A [Salegentibacter agarivorans]
MIKSILIIVSLICTVNIYAQQKPNVIVVLADDIGIGDISHYRKMHSNNIILKTPTLDKLAKSGMLFTNAHSPAALCAPTRYAVMTGNNSYRSYAPWGVWGAYQQSPVKTDQLTLGKVMKNAGYSTGFFGKWGFGMDFYRKGDTTKIYRGDRSKLELDVDIKQIAGRGPIENGFDYSITYPSGIQDVPYAVYENQKWMPLTDDSKIDLITQDKMDRIGVTLDKDEGLGDSAWNPHHMGPLLVNKAIDFIQRQDSPFFMYYCSLAVHLPHTPSDKLNNKRVAGTTPSSHLDMVKELDIQMEMLVQTLKDRGIYDNTIIIFTSDNGGLQRKETSRSGHESNDIYRGGKNQPYEGGHRVPFFASWPGTIKANSTSDVPIIGIDILSTLADITNQDLDADVVKDSASLLPILLGESDENVHPFLMLQAGTGKEGIIIKDGWKLIIDFDKKDKTGMTRTPSALFNLEDNVEERESENLISDPKYKEKVATLFKLYNETRDSGAKTKL